VPLVALVALSGLATLVVSGGVYLAIQAYKREQQRVASLAALAASKGWQFSAVDPFGLVERWDGDPFGNGYDRAASNVVSGELDGRPVIAFDYEYKEDSTDSKGNRSTTTYRYAVCALAMPCPLPSLAVTPEGLFSRLGNMLGMEDIELESEDFNRTFRVRCDDRKLAMDVLPPRTMQLLLSAGKMHFRFAGRDILSWEDGRLLPVDVLNRTAVLAGVVAGVPEFVWKDRS
jgi:hypothetical protein